MYFLLAENRSIFQASRWGSTGPPWTRFAALQRLLPTLIVPPLWEGEELEELGNSAATAAVSGGGKPDRYAALLKLRTHRRGFLRRFRRTLEGNGGQKAPGGWVDGGGHATTCLLMRSPPSGDLLQTRFRNADLPPRAATKASPVTFDPPFPCSVPAPSCQL